MRRSTSDSFALGTALNWQEGRWRLSSTGNAELTHSITRTDNGPDLSDAQDQVDAGTLEPLGDLGPVGLLPRDRSRSNRYSLGLDGTATGPARRAGTSGYNFYDSYLRLSNLTRIPCDGSVSSSR